jgi:hypothetical protein
MAKNLDLTLLPLYRLRGNELPSPPGLMALTPPRRPARSRDNDRLIVHLTLGGNAPFSTVNYLQMTAGAAEEFYKTPGTVTSALRAAATALNGDLLERNMELSGQGRYSVGNLILCALRGNQLYVLESGPTHIFWMVDHERVYIHEPSLSGRGLGMGQAMNAYLTQIPIRAGGRLLLSPKFSPAWEQILQRDNHSAPLEILRSALMRQSTEDENAVLIEVSAGRGMLNVLKPKRQPQPTLEIITKRLEEEPKLAELPPREEKPIVESHQPQPLPSDLPEDGVSVPDAPVKASTNIPSRPIRPPREIRNPEKDWTADLPEYVREALASEPEEKDDAPPRREPASTIPKPKDIMSSIPRRETAAPMQAEAPAQDNETKPPQERDILASIPKKAVTPPTAAVEAPISAPVPDAYPEPVEEIRTGPSTREVVARRSARVLAKGIQSTREGNEKLKSGFEKMLPRLLPSDEEAPVRLPTWTMSLIAVIIPLIVVTIATVVYFRFGRDMRYENYYTQAQEARNRAIEQNDPLAQRMAWEDTLTMLSLAEERKVTEETVQLRAEAEGQIDALLNILRLTFTPAVHGLPRGIKITSIAANDSEIFMLDESTGTVLRAYLVGEGYQYDAAFICEAGNYGGKLIDRLVEIQILPKSNAMGASILAFDTQGGLLYCAANATPQALHLSQPSVGFRDITAVALQSDVLYVLDAPSREVWVYGGQASTFINYPTAFFSTETPSGIEYAVDISVNDTDLYLLFNDGHLATCTYSLLESVPTSCISPVTLVDRNPAAGGGNNFGAALFNKMAISDPPDAAILLMAGETQSIFRFSPRSYELLNQLKPRSDGDYALPSIALTAVTTNANHVLFIAQDDQVFMSFEAP